MSEVDLPISLNSRCVPIYLPTSSSGTPSFISRMPVNSKTLPPITTLVLNISIPQFFLFYFFFLLSYSYKKVTTGDMEGIVEQVLDDNSVVLKLYVSDCY